MILLLIEETLRATVEIYWQCAAINWTFSRSTDSQNFLPSAVFSTILYSFPQYSGLCQTHGILHPQKILQIGT